MAELVEQCSFGKADSPCHLHHYTRRTELIPVKDLTLEDQTLLLARSKTASGDTPSTVCLHHKALFLSQFVKLQRNKCCNPFELHLRKRKVRGKGVNLFLGEK